jgi:hypothetical protein
VGENTFLHCINKMGAQSQEVHIYSSISLDNVNSLLTNKGPTNSVPSNITNNINESLHLPEVIEADLTKINNSMKNKKPTT